MSIIELCYGISLVVQMEMVYCANRSSCQVVTAMQAMCKPCGGSIWSCWMLQSKLVPKV